MMSPLMPVGAEAGWLEDLACGLRLKSVVATEGKARAGVDRFTGIALELGQSLTKQETAEKLINACLSELGDAIYGTHLLRKEGTRGAEVENQLREVLKVHALSVEVLQIASEVVAARAIAAGKAARGRGTILRASPEKVRENYQEQLTLLDLSGKSQESSLLLKNGVADAEGGRLSENDSEFREYVTAVESNPGFNLTCALPVTFQKERRAAGFWSHSKENRGRLEQTRRMGHSVVSWISQGVEGAFSGALAALDRDLAFRYWLGEPIIELGEKMDHSDYLIVHSEVVSRASSVSTDELVAGREELGRCSRLLDAYSRRQVRFPPFRTDQTVAVERLMDQVDRELQSRGR